MQPTHRGAGRGRLIIGILLAAVLAATGVAAGVVLANRAGGADRTETATPITTSTPAPAVAASADVLSAAQGAAARARRTQFQPLVSTITDSATEDLTRKDMGGQLAAASASLGAVSDKPVPAECGSGDGDYQPTPDEMASANTDTELLAAAFTTYGIAVTRASDEQGFLALDWDYNDVVAQSVSDSFWADRYPSQPPTQADLDQVVAENDVVARHLAAAGISYTRTRDGAGWETVEYDYDDAAAQRAVDDAYTELYPPVAPTAEERAALKADNDRQAAAFDAADISYQRVSDELGWEWLEWNYDDPALQDKVDAVFAQLYPPTEGDPCDLGDDGISPGLDTDTEGSGSIIPLDGTAQAPSTEASPPVSDTVADSGPDGGASDEDPGTDLTPGQMAQRKAEAAALVTGFANAGVTSQLVGESPWESVTFDVTNPASVTVVAEVLASRH